MVVKNDKELKGLMRIGEICGEALQHMLRHVEVGMTTKQLDNIGAEFLQQHGARSAPILAYQYPGYTCISINDVAAHGIPGDQVIQAGDMVNVDVSAELEGYWADTGASMIVPPQRPDYVRMTEYAKMALNRAIDTAKAGVRVHQIGKAVEQVARKGGYRVLRQLNGHGVGRGIHEKPTIPNTYNRRNRDKLKEGHVVTLEPFFTMGKGDIVQDPDGWTLRTADGKVAVQYEHTVVITNSKPILITKVASSQH